MASSGLQLTPEHFRAKPSQRQAVGRLEGRDLLQGIGAVIVVALFATLLRSVLPPWPEPQSIGIMRFWLLMSVNVALALYSTVAVHELGHLLMAKLLRYHIVLISVGAWGLAHERSGWRWRQVHRDWMAMRGSTIALQPDAYHHRHKELLVIMGGPLAQLLLLIFLLILSRFHFSNGGGSWSIFFLHSATYLTFIGLCSSILPLRFGMVATDAYHAVRLLHGGDAVERQLLIQRLTARLFVDTPYHALDLSALDAACKPDDLSRNSYAAHLLAASRALELNDGEGAAHSLNTVLRFVLAQPSARSAGWPFLYAARYELAFGAGPAVARQWLTLIGPSLLSVSALDIEQARLAVEAAILHAEGDEAMSYTKAKQSIALLPRRLDAGGAAGECIRLSALLAQLPPMPEFASSASFPLRHRRLTLSAALQSVFSLAMLTLLVTLF